MTICPSPLPLLPIPPGFYVPVAEGCGLLPSVMAPAIFPADFSWAIPLGVCRAESGEDSTDVVDLCTLFLGMSPWSRGQVSITLQARHGSPDVWPVQDFHHLDCEVS